MRDERRHEREPEKTKLVVRGTHAGTSFEEETETVDLSMVGVSFYLKTPISFHSFVSIEIGSSSLLTHTGRIQALVVRIDTSSSGKRLIGAKFL
jgi:PilZ domain-containing protein